MFVIKTALLFKKKVMLYANGIGPIKKENYRITGKILNKVDVITLRESLSLNELKNIGVAKPKIILTADSAFNLDFRTSGKNPLGINKDYICVSVRDYKKMPENFDEIIVNVCNYVYEKYNCIAVFIPFQKTKDTKICGRIKDKIKYEGILFDTDCKIEDLFDLFASARMCIGMRLHSLIYASICTVPSVGLVYDPKIVGFMEYIGQKRYISADTLDIENLIKMIDDCFENYDYIKQELRINLNKMKKKAEENAQEAIKLLCE